MEENKEIKEESPINLNDSNFRQQIKKYFILIWDFLKIAIIATIIVLPIRYFIFQPFIVKGESMMPNFRSGDYLIVDQISYKIGDPQRGDVIVFKYPLDKSQRYIKRIIGLPHEKVEIKNGEIIIFKNIEEGSENDSESIILNEKKYLPDLENTKGDLSVTLSENEFFVLGDNRPFSHDSRGWGLLPEKDIIGRALFRVFPIKNVSYIPQKNY